MSDTPLIDIAPPGPLPIGVYGQGSYREVTLRDIDTGDLAFSGRLENADQRLAAAEQLRIIADELERGVVGEVLIQRRAA